MAGGLSFRGFEVLVLGGCPLLLAVRVIVWVVGWLVYRYGGRCEVVHEGWIGGTGDRTST